MKVVAWLRRKELRPLIALLSVAFVSVGLLQANYYQMRAMIQTQITAFNGLTQARLNMQRGYLIAEQVLNGNQTLLAQDAIAYLDWAILAVDDWQQGQNPVAVFDQLLPPAPPMAQALSQYRQDLGDFRSLLLEHLNRPQNQAQTTIDRRIAFSQLELEAEQLENRLYLDLEIAIKRQSERYSLILVGWSIFLIMIAGLVYRLASLQRLAVAQLSASENQFRAQYAGIPIPTYTWRCVDNDFMLETYNDAAISITQGTITQLINQSAKLFYQHDSEILDHFQRCYQTKKTIHQELRYQFKFSDQFRDLYVSYVFIEPDLIMVHTEDRTDRNQLQMQLIRAQKMESIGRLAGGVAHDFNNLLTAISGYTTLAIDSFQHGLPVLEELAEIQHATNRAALLTSQLLTFARKQQLQPKIINLNDLIIAMEKLIKRVLPESIHWKTVLNPAIDVVVADAGQIEQVLLNLVVNARDAMPNGGHLLVETYNLVVDAAYARSHVDVPIGQYVVFAVSDTGIGMSQAVQSRAFEPFFTTKSDHEGTGLGLATSYGIIKQHGGQISLYSEVDRGTTIKIYLPRSEQLPAIESPHFSQNLPRGNETILVSEDEPQVRAVLVRMLQGLGYRVLEAAHGSAALEVLQAHATGTIKLLISDLVMPQMGGFELGQLVSELDPSLKILFISGYSEHSLAQQQQFTQQPLLLSKPFSLATLAQTVRNILDA
ncbi:ATP-binding protein [Herpetosiphon geysericola]|uniref:ATP-binding protein n=1 Tax=Herpetosiphon geysericola TaxID=70996 RepID=UPI0006C8F691|nr:ATP-binding protein [Herpetosiphon geysericola]